MPCSVLPPCVRKSNCQRLRWRGSTNLLGRHLLPLGLQRRLLCPKIL